MTKDAYHFAPMGSGSKFSERLGQAAIPLILQDLEPIVRSSKNAQTMSASISMHALLAGLAMAMRHPEWAQVAWRQLAAELDVLVGMTEAPEGYEPGELAFVRLADDIVKAAPVSSSQERSP